MIDKLDRIIWEKRKKLILKLNKGVNLNIVLISTFICWLLGIDFSSWMRLLPDYILISVCILKGPPN